MKFLLYTSYWCFQCSNCPDFLLDNFLASTDIVLGCSTMQLYNNVFALLLTLKQCTTQYCRYANEIVNITIAAVRGLVE